MTRWTSLSIFKYVDRSKTQVDLFLSPLGHQKTQSFVSTQQKISELNNRWNEERERDHGSIDWDMKSMLISFEGRWQTFSSEFRSKFFEVLWLTIEEKFRERKDLSSHYANETANVDRWMESFLSNSPLPRRIEMFINGEREIRLVRKKTTEHFASSSLFRSSPIDHVDDFGDLSDHCFLFIRLESIPLWYLEFVSILQWRTRFEFRYLWISVRIRRLHRTGECHSAAIRLGWRSGPTLLVQGRPESTCPLWIESDHRTRWFARCRFPLDHSTIGQCFPLPHVVLQICFVCRMDLRSSSTVRLQRLQTRPTVLLFENLCASTCCQSNLN